MPDHAERLAAIEAVAGDAFVWIEAHIKALEALDMEDERKEMWLQRWQVRRAEILAIGARVHHDRKA